MKSKIIILICLILVIGLAFLFVFVDNKKPKETNENEVGRIGKEEIVDYLENCGIVRANYNGEIFADYYEFKRTKDKIFVWAYIMEYYINENIKEGSGTSLPLVLNISEGEITGHKESRDGAHHGEDIKKMFPEELHDEVLGFNTQHKQELNNLISSVEEKAKEQLEEEDFDREIVVGETNTIELEANKTTGYEWHYNINNENIIKVKEDTYIEDEHKKGMTGVGGTRVITIEGIKKGETTIEFEYYRPSEPEKVEETRKVKVKVSEAPNYQFPKEIEADYISVQDWKAKVIKNDVKYPEKFKVIENGITCEETTTESSFPSRIYSKEIDNKNYCIEAKSEGAAGTTYTEYAYSTLKDNNLVTISFLAKYVSCGNYPESKRVECEEERETFDLDQVVSKVINSN
ncbi:MAG: protease inhibitor I42 family protein [Candidatus Woesearchaeota archaeon]